MGLEHLWKLRVAKCTPLWREARFRLKVEMSKKCTPLRREARFEAKVPTSDEGGPLLDVQMLFLRGRRKGLCTLSKVSKT